MSPLKIYRQNMRAAGLAKGKTDEDVVRDTHAWWTGSGRSEFISSFEHETGIPLAGVKRSAGALIEQGYPKNINEYQGKTAWDQYYIANALIAVGELDRLFDPGVPFKSGATEIWYHNIVGLSSKLFLDTIVLIDDWATFKHKTPGIVGIGKNRFERAFALYQSARQIIYGNVSAFSFSDNQSDTAVNQLRMAIEIRIRRGFGIVAKVTHGDAVVPLALSEILDAIRPRKGNITFPVPFEHIERIYGWANIYMHSGFKQYTWSPMYALRYLHVFLAGGKYPGGTGVNAGIVCKRGIIKQVQSAVEGAIDKRKHSLIVDDPSVCDAIIQK